MGRSKKLKKQEQVKKKIVFWSHVTQKTVFLLSRYTCQTKLCKRTIWFKLLRKPTHTRVIRHRVRLLSMCVHATHTPSFHFLLSLEAQAKPAFMRSSSKVQLPQSLLPPCSCPTNATSACRHHVMCLCVWISYISMQPSKGSQICPCRAVV